MTIQKNDFKLSTEDKSFIIFVSVCAGVVALTALIVLGRLLVNRDSKHDC